MPKGETTWRKLRAEEPKTQSTKRGSVIGKTENWEGALLAGLSAKDRESLSLSMNATGTETVEELIHPRPESLSAKDIWQNGAALTVWTLSPQMLLDSSAKLEFLDPAELGPDKTARLMTYAYGIGLDSGDTIIDICRYLGEAGYNVEHTTVKEAVLFFLDNVYLG